MSNIHILCVKYLNKPSELQFILGTVQFHVYNYSHSLTMQQSWKVNKLGIRDKKVKHLCLLTVKKEPVSNEKSNIRAY
jgi:hypothetical protein